ncbi:hypothetical protein GGS23DRAFT_310475 [Durotheca rogersii]|uniref:uncharacterized protein n=1 Tax=Durotheca rogersii TaxID=419775 RepID=UPI00221EDABA|nr:uncharacterized protein GGS23DRAFT_310475 [Durotheca rogersii]KAI5859685.1 hypothetical protein GGS23DRAFT_310475 [Durotheca rogersii]
MALLGLSLLFASAVYLVLWKPPLLQTLLALWRGDPRIQQPPTTRRPSPSSRRADPDRRPATGDAHNHLSVTAPTSLDADRPTLTPPPPSSPRADLLSSPTVTPRAAPTLVRLPSISSIPSLSLSAANPSADEGSSAATLPQLSVPTLPSDGPSLAPVTTTSMAPPPLPPARRPPTLNSLPTHGSSPSSPSLLSVSPSSRPSPFPSRQQPNSQGRDRQSGSSTLAPPPTHSTRPSKPSRKVTLEPGRSPLDWARLANHPTADLRGLGPGAPYLRVTPSILRRQTGRKGKDAWTVLGGRVYNISPYLPFHPGGEPELLRAAGRDGSKLFGEIHPWVNYETMLASCLVGLLVEEHEAKSTGEMDAMD